MSRPGRRKERTLVLSESNHSDVEMSFFPSSEGRPNHTELLNTSAFLLRALI